MRIYDLLSVKTPFYLLFSFSLAFFVIYELVVTRQNFVDYFSYFTIFVNTLGAGMYLLNALNKSVILESFKLALNVYMLIAAIVYFVLLRHIPIGQESVFANIFFHRIVPLVVIFDITVFRALFIHKIKTVFYWLVFAYVYAAYIFIRGFTTGNYTYYFLDPIETSFEIIVFYILAITLLGLVISAIVINVSNKRKQIS